MFRIRRFGVIRTATVVAVMYVVIVLLIAIPIGIALLAAGTGTGRPSGTDGTAAVGGLLVIGLLGALLYAALGWIFTAIACLIYNLAARWTGGIEVEVERVEAAARPVPAPWGPAPPGASPPHGGQQPPSAWGSGG